MHYRLADYILWIATPLLQAGVLWAMYRRGLNRRYPFFLAYMVLQVVGSILLGTLVAHSYTAYYYAYYWNLVMSIVISGGVSWEILKLALRRPKARKISLFAILCVVVLLIGAVGLLLTRGASSGDGLMTGAMMLSDRVLRALQILLFLGLIFFRNSLKLSCRSVTFGLAFGFGVFAIANVLVAVALSHRGVLNAVTLSEINGVAYLGAVAIWLLYVAFGMEDESGTNRTKFLPMSGDDDRPGPKPPTRWFFREGLLVRRAVAQG